MHNSISGTEAADRLAIRYLIDALGIECNMPSKCAQLQGTVPRTTTPH
jgi:hypothetical protein